MTLRAHLTTRKRANALLVPNKPVDVLNRTGRGLGCAVGSAAGQNTILLARDCDSAQKLRVRLWV
jgi:hypothetical protein